MPLDTETGIGPCKGYIVLDGDPAPLQMGTAPPPHFWAHGGQTAGWINMPLGRPTEKELDRPRPDCVSAERVAAAPPPVFGPCLLWQNVTRVSYVLLSCC